MLWEIQLVSVQESFRKASDSELGLRGFQQTQMGVGGWSCTWMEMRMWRVWDQNVKDKEWEGTERGGGWPAVVGPDCDEHNTFDSLV